MNLFTSLIFILYILKDKEMIEEGVKNISVNDLKKDIL